MGFELQVIIALAVLIGVYMAWGIGANDVANAMGTSVGSGALTLKRAVILAAILEFAGAFLVGSHVSETVRKGIVDVSVFQNDGMSFMLGMLAALLAAGVWLQFASWKGWPVSTTHSIVGAVIGFGAAYGGMAAVHWDKVGEIVASWVISPLCAGIVSFLLFQLIRRQIFYAPDPLRAARRTTPFLVFMVFTVLTLVLLFKGLKNVSIALTLPQALGVAGAAGLVAALVTVFLMRRVGKEAEAAATEAGGLSPDRAAYLARSLRKATKHLQRVRATGPDELRTDVANLLKEVRRIHGETTAKQVFTTDSRPLQKVERIFVRLQILSACFVAFAHGANDVANAIGPMSAVIAVARAGGEAIAAKAPVPTWVLALGGVGIVVGLATWGWRVMETVGRRITELTPSRGFCAEFGAATTIVVASKLGLPISTTHTLVGAVIGVALARGMRALDVRVVRDIAISWVVTIPAGAGLAVVFFHLLRLAF